MISLRKIKTQDLSTYQHWKHPRHRYHTLNGPYFQKQTAVEVEAKIQSLRAAFEKGSPDPLSQKRMIVNSQDELLGEVNWYWKSEETNWLEIGVVIFDEANWGKGIGYEALKLWIDEMFTTRKEIVRIGLTTWSGNEGMMKLSEKLRLKKEAVYRNARIVDGAYFDSVSYGILRSEWYNR